MTPETGKAEKSAFPVSACFEYRYRNQLKEMSRGGWARKVHCLSAACLPEIEGHVPLNGGETRILSD
jgi:hypothetical protein